MAYNNTFELAQSFLPILDEVYRASSKTAILDTANDRVRWIGADTVNLYTMNLDGLAIIPETRASRPVPLPAVGNRTS